MTKLAQAFLTGLFFTFILDFQFFLGIKLHYIDFYQIDTYYNILFADNQNIFYLIPLVIIIGFVTTYIENIKIPLIILGLLFAVTLLVYIPSVGERMGANMLQKENVRYHDGRFIYKGTLYYNGRHTVTLFDDDLQRLVTLNKKDLQE